MIQVDVTETTMVTAGIDVEYYKTEGGAADGNPTYHDGTFLDIARSTNLGADWAQDRRHSQNYFLKVDQELPNDRSLQGQLAFANVSANFLESSTWGSVDPVTGLGAGIWGAREVWDSKTTSLDLYTSGPVEFLGREHELVFGFNGFYRDYFASGYTETIDAVEYIDVRDHDPTAVPGPDSLPWVIYGDDFVPRLCNMGYSRPDVSIQPTRFTSFLVEG